jgi:hypothetical protein
VEIALARGGTGYAVAFEIVVEVLDPAQAPSLRELELCIFAKAGRIRVEKGASISKRLENELSGGNLVRELGPLLAGIADTKFEKGLDGKSTALRLPTPRLTAVKKSG